MNKLLSIQGGMPLRIDDLIFIQDNVQSLTSALANAFSDSDFMIHGGRISLNNSGGSNPLLTITEGALWKADEKEIFLIDPVVSVSLPSGTTLEDVLTWEWDKVTTLTGSRVYKDGLTHQPLEINKAVLVETPTTWSGVEADLISYYDINKKESNLDILNKDFENPNDFTTITTDGSTVYKQYIVSSGQHLARWYTPSGGNATITRILPPSDVYEGYELTIEVRKHPTGNRGLEFPTQLSPTTPSQANINMHLLTFAYGYSSPNILRTETDQYQITWNVSYDDLYATGSGYDINTHSNGAFKIILRWSENTSDWTEVSRTKTSF